jgi:hypothetical protein
MKRVVEVHVCDGCGAEITPEQIGAEVNATMYDEDEPYVRRIELCGKGKGLNNCAGNLPEGVKQKKRGRKATEAPAAEPAAA